MCVLTIIFVFTCSQRIRLSLWCSCSFLGITFWWWLAYLPRRILTATELLTEFVAVMSRKVNASYTADQVKNAFKVRFTSSSLVYCSVEVLDIPGQQNREGRGDGSEWPIRLILGATWWQPRYNTIQIYNWCHVSNVCAWLQYSNAECTISLRHIRNTTSVMVCT